MSEVRVSVLLSWEKKEVVLVQIPQTPAALPSFSTFS